jgi:multimeric flavodoxin WrbA
MGEAVGAGVRQGGGPTVDLRVRTAFEAQADDLTWCRAVILGTPANFGYMSGALKDFFERTYPLCLGRTEGLSYALFAKGDSDVDGAVASVERIVAGLRWKRVAPPLAVVGALTQKDLDAAWDLGATVAAGVEAGIF